MTFDHRPDVSKALGTNRFTAGQFVVDFCQAEFCDVTKEAMTQHRFHDDRFKYLFQRTPPAEAVCRGVCMRGKSMPYGMR